MKLQAAVLNERGVKFAVVIVRRHLLNDRLQASRTAVSLRPAFSGLPVILMSQDQSGRANYFGRRDIVDFLSGVPVAAIPWREYTLQ